MSVNSDITAGLANIWQSDYVQKNPNKAYKSSYAVEYGQVAAYLNGGPEPNFSGFSKLGQGLCQAERARRASGGTPPVPGPGQGISQASGVVT